MIKRFIGCNRSMAKNLKKSFRERHCLKGYSADRMGDTKKNSRKRI